MREVMAALRAEEKRLVRELAGVRGVIARAERASGAATGRGGRKAKRPRRARAEKASGAEGRGEPERATAAPQRSRAVASKGTPVKAAAKAVPTKRGSATTSRAMAPAPAQSRRSALLSAVDQEAGNG